MNFTYDPKKISIEKTANYFEEAVKCYEAGCYRATMGTLYCVCMCDIIYKLEEARDAYNFSVAEDILNEMNKNRQDSPKEKWEKPFIDAVHEKTELFDDASYKMLMDIREWRHLSVHPAMDENNNLIEVTQAEAYAKLQSAYDGLLTKPAIHTKSKNIVGQIADDLLQRRDELTKEKDLKAYVNKIYHLETIHDDIYLNIFRAFWKFNFLIKNADTERGRSINKRFLHFLCTERKDSVLRYIQNKQKYFDISRDLWEEANAFLCSHKYVYDVLPEYTQLMLQTKIRTSNYVKDIFGGWYINNNLEEHLQDMKAKLTIETLYSSESEVRLFRDIYKKLDLGCLDKFLIEKIKAIPSFSKAGIYYSNCLEPYIKDWTNELCDLFYNVSSQNDQMYYYCVYPEMCQKVAKRAFDFQTREELIRAYPFLRKMLPE